jgi:hypothetical protein
MASLPKSPPSALPGWFPTQAQEARAARISAEEAPQRPFSADEDRALRVSSGTRGAVKLLAIALGRSPAELYRRRARLLRLSQPRSE